MLTRRKFIVTGVAAATAVAFHLEEEYHSPFPSQLRITPHSLPGPASLVGKRIAVVSDLHIGHFFDLNDFNILLAKLHEMKPDIVMMPGDVTHVPGADLSDYLDAYGQPSWPTYFSPGNHDKKDANDLRTQSDLANAGWRVLCNQREDHADFTIIGMESGLRGTIDHSLLKTNLFKIVLGHEPDYWSGYTQPNLLHLAGHSHGGQIQLFGGPLLLPSEAKIYYEGLYERANHNRLIVSRGIGTKLVNVRVNCPPEIVVITFT